MKTIEPFAATIVFTAHNRRDLVLESIRLAKMQTLPVEIIVMDDCSTDGTGDAIADRFPDVLYERSDRARGPCYQRNRGIALATSEIVFPLDDDSWLVSPRTIEQTLADFCDPSVGLVAIPFRNVVAGPEINHARDEMHERRVVAAFVACSHALRKSMVAAIGGYNESFFYMVEESDLSLRILQGGYHIELGTADPIDHMQPAFRRSARPDYYGRRNLVLLYYTLCPQPLMPMMVLGSIFKGLMFGAQNQHFRIAARAIRDAVALCLSGEVKRRPVEGHIFAEFRQLQADGQWPLSCLSNRPAR